MHVLLVAACLLLLPIGLAVAYRATFALTYLLHPRRRPSTPPALGEVRFAALIPAHDEELLIGEAVDSIKACRYPKHQIDVYVVADNCSDATAYRAREHGGLVLERRDLENRGKGQALAWLISRIDLSPYDAIAIFDADSLVDPDFFNWMAPELLDGARCLQGYYDIANPDSSTFTRLLSVTYVMKNVLFNAGKRLAGFSVSLMGTGMVFTREVIERHGWRASSVAEDLEHSMDLMEREEIVRFVPDARIRAQEARDFRTGYTQRQRWATGRRALRRRAWLLVLSGLRSRSLERIDLGCDLLMPSYSGLLNATVLLVPVTWFVSELSVVPLVANLLLLGYQMLEVCVAYALMGAHPRDLLALAYAPAFLAWKGAIEILARFGVQKTAWIRTARSHHPGREQRPTGTEGPS